MSAAHNVHASAVAFGPRGGVLILGASGSGKSRMALSLIAEGAQLVSDDQVLLTPRGTTLFARAPHPLAGLLEVRGLGILQMTHRRLAQIVLVLDLDGPRGPRLPDPATRQIAGVTLPCLPADSTSPSPYAVLVYIAKFAKLE